MASLTAAVGHFVVAFLIKGAILYHTLERLIIPYILEVADRLMQTIEVGRTSDSDHPKNLPGPAVACRSLNGSTKKKLDD